MISGDFLVAFVALVGPLLIAISFLTTITVIVGARFSRVSPGRHAPIIASFALLGGVSGLIAGVSQEPTVGALLTGMLGVITALLSYMLSLQSLEGYRQALPYSVIMLVFSALIGLACGGSVREARIETDRRYAEWLMDHEKVFVPRLRAEQMVDLCKVKLPVDHQVACIEKAIGGKD